MPSPQFSPTLIGGAGNDTFDGGAGEDTVVLAGNRTGYTLGLNLENLILTGWGNINGAGNELNNTLTGNGGNNLLTGGDGDDTLDGGGGTDTLLGGLGTDTLTYRGNESKIDGGAGSDTLKIGGAGMVLDLGLLVAGKISGIEKLDLTGSGNNSLLVNKTSLLNLTGTAAHDLFVTGDAGDSVTVEVHTGAKWTDVSIINIDGVNYHQYAHTSGAVADHLYVQDTLTQNLV